MRRWCLLALLTLPACAKPGHAQPAPPALSLDEVMGHLAQASERRADFVEEKRLAALRAPLRSEGRLAYRKPDHLEKLTTAPQPESLVVDGGRLVVSDGSSEPPRVFSLDSQPQLRTLVDTIRGALSGDLPALRRLYDVTGSGTPAAWLIVLRPRDPAVARLVTEVRLTGGTDLQAIQSFSPNGDTDTLTVTPRP